MAEISSSPASGGTSLGDHALTVAGAKITQFEITGLFGRPLNHKIQFPQQSISATEPDILIIAGPNGCGKTTIFRMIDGMLRLNFDMFRQTPFTTAKLSISTGDELSVKSIDNEEFPLLVQFNDKAAELSKDKVNYSPQQNEAIALFRKTASPILKNVRFQLLDIHRSAALRQAKITEEPGIVGGNTWTTIAAVPVRVEGLHIDHRRPDLSMELSRLILEFIREAQVNYRKFFVADQLELLPRILSSLTGTLSEQQSELAARVAAIKERSSIMTRFGLQTDDTDLDTLTTLLSNNSQYSDNASLAVLATYVSMQETRNQTRELIMKRLLNFEAIMEDFLVGKTVRVDPTLGLRIEAPTGPLKETDLSSGEYHFLYMMVSALLSHRTGSIIAIDEPELSLHVTWQRKVIGALARCASGASPLFLFATHSAAISAEHKERVKVLAVEE